MLWFGFGDALLWAVRVVRLRVCGGVEWLACLLMDVAECGVFCLLWCVGFWFLAFDLWVVG